MTGTKNQSIKIIFGLKLKQLRTELGYSGKDLAARANVSVSYLNEIEKGKKYPKKNKIASLATALGVSYEELTSPKLKHELAPVSRLLNSNFLNELPLDLFGIELNKVVEIIASAPVKVGAFISTLVDLARNYAMGEEHFYFGALRSYLEMHDNYFEELEEKVCLFIEEKQLQNLNTMSSHKLAAILKNEYDYEIVENGLTNYPDLQALRAIFIPQKKQLLLNKKLNEVQRTFQYGKEIGFNYLNLSPRANTSSLLKVNSFEEVLSHFRAGYFSAALLIRKEQFIKDIEHIFAQKEWNGEAILSLLTKYNVAPETLFQRLTNVLPSVLRIKNLFLHRFKHFPSNGCLFKLDKELHINLTYKPDGNGMNEHYCRRWLSLSLLEDFDTMKAAGKYTDTIIGVEKSKYLYNGQEYLCMTLARAAYPSPDKNVSVTIGILIDESVRDKIKFINDPAIVQKQVSTTCERCSIMDCKERSAPPLILESRERKRNVGKALKKLLDN